MDLKTLRYFLAICEEKTILKAAEVLHLSQPALSKQMKDLEDELGVQLFFRGNRHITLTEGGIFMRNRALEILTLVDATTSQLQHNSVISGKLVIGAGETNTFSLLAKVMNELSQDYPDLSFQLYSGNSDTIKEKIDKGTLEFGLAIDPVDKHKYDHLRLPHIDRWGVMVNDTHPLAHKEAICPEDLTEYPIMIPSKSLIQNYLAEWLGSNLNYLKIIGTYNLLFNASFLTHESDTIIICIDRIINTQGSTLHFIPFTPLLPVSSSLIWKRNVSLSPVAQLFLNQLKCQLNDK